MDAEKMTITLDTDDMRTVLASVGFVVCDWKEKARDEKSGKMAHESAVRNCSPIDALPDKTIPRRWGILTPPRY